MNAVCADAVSKFWFFVDFVFIVKIETFRYTSKELIDKSLNSIRMEYRSSDDLIAVEFIKWLNKFYCIKDNESSRMFRFIFNQLIALCVLLPSVSLSHYTTLSIQVRNSATFV